MIDLKRVSEELKAHPLSAPYDEALAFAIVCDMFRGAGVVPPSSSELKRLLTLDAKTAEQFGMLAHLLRVTSMRDERPASGKPMAILEQFFEEIRPLTAEMIRSNAFRQEEFLRKWANAIGVRIHGEKAKQSESRRHALDYRRTIDEYVKAENARKEEAKKREEALKEAERRAAEARGWRE